HSMEFHHLDGIIMDESVNFRSLLGILKEFLARIGLTQLKFKPAYFPFTEPSVEVYAHHDRLGWMEVLGAGMFRPEVLLPLDIKYPVLAWGMGVERLAMAVLGIDDIRKLYTRDLSFLREFSVPL
ncbi:phenylalanine--tRNA ligase subunit alpha, partial [archaeon]